MKLPFVILPRDVYEHLLKTNVDERDRTRRLLKLVTKLKLNGAILPRTPITTYPSSAVDPRSTEEKQIDDAIESHKYANRPGIRTALRTYVERSRRDNIPAARIIHTLQNWSNLTAPSADDVADDDDDLIAIRA